MQKLGDRNYALISMGAKSCGDYEEAYYFIEESLYVHEAEEINEFLLWCKSTGKHFGHGNYEERFAEFKARETT